MPAQRPRARSRSMPARPSCTKWRADFGAGGRAWGLEVGGPVWEGFAQGTLTAALSLGSDAGFSLGGVGFPSTTWDSRWGDQHISIFPRFAPQEGQPLQPPEPRQIFAKEEVDDADEPLIHRLGEKIKTLLLDVSPRCSTHDTLPPIHMEADREVLEDNFPFQGTPRQWEHRWFAWWFFLIYQGHPSICPKRTPEWEGKHANPRFHCAIAGCRLVSAASSRVPFPCDQWCVLGQGKLRPRPRSPAF